MVAPRGVAVVLLLFGGTAGFASSVRAQNDLVSLSLRADALVTPWVDAVRRHRPGDVDSALMVPAGWSRVQVQQAWVYIQMLAMMLRGVDVGSIVVVQHGVKRRPVVDKSDFVALRDLTESIIRTGTANDFIKRAAILHTDVVNLLKLSGGNDAHNVSLLMPRRFMVETDDGRQRSVGQGAVHWEFARVLLDRLENPSEDSFVLRWYRATLRYKLGLAELDTPHFIHALSLFPKDAEMRFLMGSLHEAFADPTVQASRGALKLPPHLQLAFDDLSSELARVEDLLRGVLSLDPSHAEARTRLGWALFRRGRPQDAAEQLRRAIGDTNEDVLRYYGYLFLGLAMESLSRFGEATAAFDQALALQQARLLTGWAIAPPPKQRCAPS